MIALSNVSKHYGRQLLLVEASFQLDPGDKVGLVGPNGSGKSTLFRLIAGEEAPDDGQVNVPRSLTPARSPALNSRPMSSARPAIHGLSS